ncbi:MAG: 2Fe-2S iron-sulfur cluster-binding protein [Candidatus Omnitrophota bacterium]
MPRIFFREKGLHVEADRWTSILDAALDSKVPIYHTCGGNASCSTCRVLVLKGAENLSGIETAEAQVLDAFDLKPPYRLGCQAQVLKGEVEVEIPKRTKAPRPNKTPPLPL